MSFRERELVRFHFALSYLGDAIEEKPVRLLRGVLWTAKDVRQRGPLSRCAPVGSSTSMVAQREA